MGPASFSRRRTAGLRSTFFKSNSIATTCWMRKVQSASRCTERGPSAMHRFCVSAAAAASFGRACVVWHLSWSNSDSQSTSFATSWRSVASNLRRWHSRRCCRARDRLNALQFQQVVALALPALRGVLAERRALQRIASSRNATEGRRHIRDEATADAVLARASQVERRARAVCVELARVTGGRPMHWRTVGPIGQAVGLDDASRQPVFTSEHSRASKGC
jgi:hypothetical protein